MKKLFTAFLFLSLTAPSLFADTIYVDWMAMGLNSGESWMDAFSDLQNALATAQPGDTIIVAQGTYKPGTDPAATFLISHDLVLIGGYSSGGTDYDPAMYETILSGDLNGDDVDDQAGAEKVDNVMTVVTVSTVGAGAVVIDGFTIRNGFADGTTANESNYWGGGIYATSNLVLRRCTFLQNYAKHKGGAIFAKNANLTLEDCLLEKNWANTGGGLRLEDAQYLLKNCTFQSNTAQLANWEFAWGGGAFIVNSIGEIRECTFRENTAPHHGGGLGIYCFPAFTGASVDLIDCTFEKNSTGEGGGGVYLNSRGESSDYSVLNCSFSENTGQYGGAMRIIAANTSENMILKLDSCMFSLNQATTSEGGGIIAELNGINIDFRMSNSIFSNNSAEFGGGGATIYARTDGDGGNGEARIEGCEFFQNASGAIAGAMTIGSFSGFGDFGFQVSECLFKQNQAATYAGGLDMFGGSSGDVVVENCVFEQNEAGETGGGIGLATIKESFSASVRNCHILENNSPFGSAIGADVFYTEDTTGAFTQTANIRFENCLLSGNEGEYAIASRKTGNIFLLNCTVADNTGHGLVLDSLSVATLQNNIFSNTGTEYQSLSGDAVLLSNGGNLIQDGSLGGLNPEDHENVVDPKFAGTGEYCSYYQLSVNSPGVDEGVDIADASNEDLCGGIRVQGNRIDIGALESPFTTSVREIISNELTLYPNPATDLLNIEWPETLFGSAEITLYSSDGTRIAAQLLSIDQPLQVEALPPGLYTLKMINARKTYIGKFVK